MTDEEVERLCWIHSNKFVTPELFHKKFIQPKTYRMACHILRNIYLEKGFLHVTKAEGTVFQDSLYFLTTRAIQSLDARDKLLVRSVKYPVHINPYERQHDFLVQGIRIAFEGNSDLKDIFWVSDFEMRSAITPDIKRAFLAGELDKEKWRSSWKNIQFKGRRTPDGYFEVDLDGQRVEFILEFEHHPYNEKMMNRMIGYLGDSFPEALRLVVSANTKNAIRMIKGLRAKIREVERTQWFVSDFGRATTLSFKKIWHQLDEPVAE
jgi:hypothetical protein